jgi:hypothetical protein
LLFAVKEVGRQTYCCFDNVFSKKSPREVLLALRNELQIERSVSREYSRVMQERASVTETLCKLRE